MRCKSGWAAIALLAGGGVGLTALAEDKAMPPGQAPVTKAADPADKTTAQLIADLGSDDYRVREKAGRELGQLGERALPALRAALLATDSPEVQQRLAIIVRKSDIARLVNPKRVTLAVKGKTVKEVFQSIQKQTGYKIEYSADSGTGAPKIDLELDNVPFWVAIDKVAATSGLMTSADYGDDTIRVFNQGTVNPYVAYAGPFRFVATNIQSSRSVQLSGINLRGGNGARQDYMNLNFQIQSEPKNPMLGITQAEVISAVDDKGVSLVPPKEGNSQSYYENRGNRGFNNYGSVNLNRNGATSTSGTIKSLKGKIGIILLSGTTPDITVIDPLKVKAKSFVGRTCDMSFTSLTEDPNTKGFYMMQVTLKKRNNEGREDYNWGNNIWSKIQLLDEAGNAYSNQGLNEINNDGNSVQMSITYTNSDPRTGKSIKLGPPVKLVFEEWLSITQEVTFEFKDIPLP